MLVSNAPNLPKQMYLRKRLEEQTFKFQVEVEPRITALFLLFEPEKDHLDCIRSWFEKLDLH